MVELAASLLLSRNILVALMALQSWKSFMRRWMRAYFLFHDAKAQSNVKDKTSKAASDILKVEYCVLSLWKIHFDLQSVVCIDCATLCHIWCLYCYILVIQSMIARADEAIPRSAENIALAIGALCVVRTLPWLCMCWRCQDFDWFWFLSALQICMSSIVNRLMKQTIVI